MTSLLKTGDATRSRVDTAVVDEAYLLQTKRLGMWIFIAMEMLFFAGPLFIYWGERHFYFEAFRLGSAHLELGLATVNTAVLLTSSLTMALSVRWVEEQKAQRSVLSLLLTAVLGAGFLGIKAYEYFLDARQGLFPGLAYHPSFAAPKEMFLFFSLYVLLTGLHAVHLTLGVIWCSIVAFGVFRERETPWRWQARVDILGLYWHFVDIVWVFLLPLFYLIGEKR